MKIALVTEWYTVYGGAERVLEQIIGLFPDADLFSLIDFLPEQERHFIQNKPVTTSFLQRLPFAQRAYRRYLPLMPSAVERFDLQAYDLVLSSSHAVSKGLLTTPEQLHICYLQARNLKYAYEDRGLYGKGGFTTLLEDLLLTPLRVWDSVASQRPDHTVANSTYVAQWHEHRHGVKADVIYPPVDVDLFASYFNEGPREDYYVTVGRLEPYKRTDLLVEVFNELGLPLVVIGDGTELPNLKRMAGPTIDFKGYLTSVDIARLLARAKAYVFCGKEDFGISLLEPQACGTPVIALAAGGALETVKDLSSDAPTGILFAEQTAAGLHSALETFERQRSQFSPQAALRQARSYSTERFRHEFKTYVEERWAAHSARKHG